MNCFPSHDPQVAAENARCVQPQNDWTAAAHQLGVALVAGPVRRRTDALVRDLVRLGLVSTKCGWVRLTDAGRTAFPARPVPAGPSNFGAGWGYLCDNRPEAWRSASAALCRPCTFGPRRARRPVQIVRGPRGDRGGPTVSVESDMSAAEPDGAPSLLRTIALAPAREYTDPRHFQQGYWPGVGMTDTFPAARRGYTQGPTVERTYA